MTKRTVLFFTLTFFFIVSYCQTKSNRVNLPLKQKLESVLVDDQKYRVLINLIQSNSKNTSDQNQIEYLNEQIKKQDLINVNVVTSIIDKYGWLGPEIVGVNANSALFLVIQHSDPATQEKYLPVMRDAVKNGKAQASSLALLEDRVALSQGKKQIYGSQIAMNGKTGMKFSPIEDEINVNKRRKAVGLEPIEDYAKYFGIKYKLSLSNEIVSDDTFFKRHSIALSIGLMLFFYSTALFLLFRNCNIKWFYLLLFYFIFFAISTILDYTNSHSLIKVYHGNWLLFIFFPIVFHSVTIFLIIYSFYKLLNVKSILVDIASIFISSLLYMYFINDIILKILIPESGIVFFKNLIEPIFYSGLLLLVTYILHLISSRTKRSVVSDNQN